MGDHVLRPSKKIKPAGLNGKALQDVAIGAVLQGIDAGLSSVTPVVFLIDFSDRPQHRAAADFSPLFFSTGPADKSVANYWTEVSYGAFTVSGLSSDIFGWFRSGIDFPSTITLNSQLTDTSTGLNSTNFLTLLNDLISSLDPTVDFSRYDADADGVVDSAIFVHAGYGGEDTGDTLNDIWSQTLFFSGSPIITGDGVNIEDIVIVPEEKFYNDGDGIDNGNEDLVGIGVIVHEIGHLMGLPDLYPTTTQGGVTGSFSGIGVFDLMGFGLWGNTTLTDQDTPSHLSAWSKTDLNWVDPVILSASGLINLSPVEVQPDVLKVFINGSAADPTQYILIENRQQSGSWIFDNALPGTGILIWHIDERVIDGDPLGTGITNRERNVVNINSGFKGVDVEEADGGDELDQPFAGPISFGESADFFNGSSQIYDRDNPNPGQNETNSSPIISFDQVANNGSFHPIDNQFDISLENFSVAPSLDIQFDFTIISPPSAPDWKTFDQVSTDPSFGFINGPIVSDDVNVVGQDSSNAVWFGTADRGISRLSGRVFESFNATSDNLPSDTITAFAFNENTGVMWVGTDNGIARMRDSGTGFDLIPGTPYLPGFVINDLSIDGDGFLWAATDSGLSVIDDGGTDTASDDVVVPSVISGAFDAVVVSPGGNISPLFDVVWAYDNTGRTLYRSSDESDVLQFVNRNLPLNPIVNDLAVDSTGLLWIATQNNGVLVYDDKLTVPFTDDELDPLDVDNDTITDETVYITTPTTGDIASNRVTGVTFQEIQGLPRPIVYFSHDNDGVNDGGVTEIDLNADPADRFIDGLGLTVFREQDLPDGPASNLVRNAFTDRSGNIWFSTDKGASRFGNAGILTLDSTTYVNLSAIATVTLEDDGLNVDSGSLDLALVTVTSDSDPTGFPLILQETGNDTGFFSGTFGFTDGPSVVSPGVMSRIRVENDNAVTVTYNDASPPGVITATAVWRKVVDFDDGIWISGCFIATAAFGSYSSPMVKIFRQFRDDYLLGSYLGRNFVSFYYRVSPRGARFIRENGPARLLTRSILVPLALFIHTGLKLVVLEKVFLLLCVFAVISFFWFSKRRVCRKRFD
jgi:M6 family metalloprotease-like protein